MSANTSADAAERTYLVNASSGVRTLTLPTAVGRAGKEYVAKKTDASANVVAVQTTPSQTIDGAAPPWNIRYPNECLTFVSDGSNWHITAESIDLPVDDVRDVAISSPSDGQALVYDSSSGNWVDEAVSGGGGGSILIPVTIMDGQGGGVHLWSGMPTALTEFGPPQTTGISFRRVVDLTDVTQARISLRLVTRSASALSPELRVQYPTDESTWNYLDHSAGPSVGLGGTSGTTYAGSWANLNASAKADVILRVVGINGAGTSPHFAFSVQAR